MRLSDIDFGAADAQDEYARHRALLIDGYLDLHRANELLRERHFLLLGRKGTGKTAVLQHMRATASAQDTVRVVRMGSFPFADFSSIDSGGATDVSRYPTTWRIIFLLTLVKAASEDLGIADGSVGKDFWKAIDRLKNAGLIGARDMRSLVLKVSKLGAGVNILGQGISAERSEQSAMYARSGLAESLETMLGDIATRRNYYICIDGLDDLVFRSEDRLRILGALIETADALNTFFADAGQPFKYIVACRNDVLSQIPSANLNKVVRDAGVRLNWYQDTRRPERSHLIRLVNRKARVSLPEIDDVFAEFLPARIRLDSRGSSKTALTVHYLLSYTRHTPRDLLQLLKCIQEVSTHDSVSEESVHAGIKNYAHDYFYDEILRATDLGRIKTTELVLDLVREHGRHVFTFGDLLELAQEEDALGAAALREVLRDLYDCSALGNFQEHGGVRFYTFKYRNENSSLLMRTPMILHNGLGRALNVKMQLSNIETAVLASMHSSRSEKQRDHAQAAPLRANERQRRRTRRFDVAKQQTAMNERSGPQGEVQAQEPQ